MEAHEIREKGRLVKTWEKLDGSWYTDKYQIWEVQGKYYQIQDHECDSFSGTMAKYGMVTEIEKPEPLPTHMGIILGVHKGNAWVEDKFQGTPDQIADWYCHRVKEVPYYKRNASFYLKIVELSFD